MNNFLNIVKRERYIESDIEILYYEYIVIKDME